MAKTGAVITGEYIGGFRVVRTLGSGTRAQVYLGHGGESRVAAIKVFGAGATPESIDTEIEALQRADHAHSLQLRDVASAPGGLPCLVLERLAHGSLAQLLAGRAALSPGEAVTIVAPLVAAVGALHSSGVVHGNISAGAVLFRESGAPVLCGFGHAVLLPPGTSPALLAASRAVLEDRIALGRVVSTVLSRVGTASSSELARWLGLVERDGFPDGFTHELERRVFELGHASPVRFTEDVGLQGPAGLPHRIHTAEPVAVEPAAVRPLPAGIASQSLANLGLANLNLTTIAPLVMKRLRSLRVPDLRGIRRPVWVAAGVGVAALVVALLVVPDEGGGVAAPVPAASATAAPVGAVGGDDPVAALDELLGSRAQCIRDLSILCLENSVQSGSAAMDDDVALIHGIEDGSTSGSLAGEPDGIVLLERHGDAALLSYRTGVNGQPASALLVKGEAGWRIRDYVPVS